MKLLLGLILFFCFQFSLGQNFYLNIKGASEIENKTIDSNNNVINHFDVVTNKSYLLDRFEVFIKTLNLDNGNDAINFYIEDIIVDEVICGTKSIFIFKQSLI